MYQIWRIYLDLWGYDCKKWVWPTFGCKLGQSDPIVMQLELDMSCHLLNVYTKFQIDISKHVEEKSGKRGRTDGHCHGIIRPFFKRAYKNCKSVDSSTYSISLKLIFKYWVKYYVCHKSWKGMFCNEFKVLWKKIFFICWGCLELYMDRRIISAKTKLAHICTSTPDHQCFR